MRSAPRASIIFPVAIALAHILLLPPASARLGETEEESLARYGKPSEILSKTMTGLVRDAKHLVWNYQMWVVTAAFVDGKTCRIRYMRSPGDGGIQLKDYEIAAVLDAEKGTSTWKKVPFPTGWTQDMSHDATFSLSSTRWLREDGARAVVRDFTMFLDLPRARQWETEVRQRVEQQRRSSVPAF